MTLLLHARVLLLFTCWSDGADPAVLVFPSCLIHELFGVVERRLAPGTIRAIMSPVSGRHVSSDDQSTRTVESIMGETSNLKD